jgi:hypothetical protein
MCKDCASDIHDLLEGSDRFENHDRSVIETESVEGDEVHLANHSPNPAFHVSHIAELLHWLRDEHFICGISSGTTAIKTLVGEGKLAECERCAQNASQMWAILNACDGVRRDGGSGLAPDAR